MIENMLDIATPAERVFDFVVDVRNEPRWNPQMLHAEMLTSEPLGVGTTFRVRFGRGVGDGLINDTKINRPRSWAAIGRSRALDAESAGEINDITGGCRLIMRTELRPHGILRLLTPALRWWMRRTLDQDLRRMKAVLEGGVSTATESEPTETASIVRVSVPDLCALWAESATASMNIALIGVVEGAPLMRPDGTVDLARIRLFIEARLPRAPMLLRVLRPTRLGQGTPAWIDAAHFTIADHVILAPADRPIIDGNEFLAWCAHRSVIPLDRKRPLWRLDIVPGLPSRKVGLLLVLHHVVADGLRGVALVTSLLEPTAHGQPAGLVWRSRRTPTGLDLVRDNLQRRWQAIRHFQPSRHIRSTDALRALSHAPGARLQPPSLVRSVIGGT